MAATSLVRTLEADRRWRTVSPDLVALAGYALDPGGEREDFLRSWLAAENLHVPTFVQGEVVASELSATRRGRKATIMLKAITYDTASGEPLSGTCSKRMFEGSRDAEILVRKATEKAVATMPKALQRRRVPRAMVVSTIDRFMVIDRGSREGFKTGDRVVVIRGRLMLNVGRVGKVERGSAEFSVERQTLGIVPGDRVWMPFDPSTLDSRR